MPPPDLLGDNTEPEISRDQSIYDRQEFHLMPEPTHHHNKFCTTVRVGSGIK
jgi:hypothetical protein